jgi:8-oxo-dGTP pyrophosphatase MutT (NUDIX family)
MPVNIRNAVKVLLLNEQDELLVLHFDDPRFYIVDGIYRGPVWALVGGKIEEGESLEEAALREIYEESGIAPEEVELGPVVWFGEFTLTISGKITCFKERFLVARTRQSAVTLDHLMPEEKPVVKKLSWLSLARIQQSEEIIYPVLLPEHLPAIIAGNYPAEPVEIDLTKKPKVR